MDTIKTTTKTSPVKKAVKKAPVAAQKSDPITTQIDDLKNAILESLNQNKAEAVTLIDLRGKTPFADYMVIANGRSTRQVSAMANYILQILKQHNAPLMRIEGQAAGDWVLVDTGDIIIHLFRPEVRQFYDLDQIWIDVGRVEKIKKTTKPVVKKAATKPVVKKAATKTVAKKAAAGKTTAVKTAAKPAAKKAAVKKPAVKAKPKPRTT